MREIHVNEITSIIKNLCIDANCEFKLALGCMSQNNKQLRGAANRVLEKLTIESPK
jgi:hypothetical protein